VTRAIATVGGITIELSAEPQGSPAAYAVSARDLNGRLIRPVAYIDDWPEALGAYRYAVSMELDRAACLRGVSAYA
jgi:hypothetical protein